MEEKVLITGTFVRNTRGVVVNAILTSLCILGAIICRNIVSVIFVFIAIKCIAKAIVYYSTNEQQLIVTNKQVSGFLNGKNIELPLDKISHIEATGVMGISIATASGIITCTDCSNRNSIVQVISNLLRERNTPKSSIEHIVISHSESTATTQVSPADEIRKYKALLDDGIITQEEFEAKKKQSLGL